ncbi:unnamed protein product [Rotaria sp. Silwood2]|nr:unnamed protein product [Rotaria sp. Silwood2]CAF4439716.1 unnamed protein product [Rotaria sp. Silwood2]
MQFGIWKSAKNWKWNRVVNTDFSGKFTLHPFQNKRNDGIWTEEGEVIPLSLTNAPTDRFQKRIIFWGAISSRGLIPSGRPINFTKWLRQQQPQNKKNMKKYLASNLYDKFLKEEVEPPIKLPFKNTALIPIVQDDQDNKHRTKVVMNTIESLFDEHIDPEIGDAKFADIWPIETVWGAIKEKLRGERFENESALEIRVAQEWKMFTTATCEQIMEKIPHRLKPLIGQDGEQIHKH